jgi:hypothetical protein
LKPLLVHLLHVARPLTIVQLTLSVLITSFSFRFPSRTMSSSSSSSALSPATPSLEQQLAAVNLEIQEVKQEIKDAAKAVAAAETSGDDAKAARWSDKEADLRKKEEQLRKKEEQLREKELMSMKLQLQQPKDVKHIFTHGLPPMGRRDAATKFTSNPSVPPDDKHAKAKLITGKFASLSDIQSLPCPITNMWSRVTTAGHLGGYSNEAGVNKYVEIVLEDVLEAMGIRGQVKIRAEVEVMSVRPDFMLIHMNGHPIGAIEGKQPGKIAMTNVNILGEVYDQLMHLHSIFGVDNPFAILTSYEEWRICWLNTDSSNQVAALEQLPDPPLQFSTPVKAQSQGKLTNAMQELALKDDSPEPPPTPSRSRAVGCLQIVDDEFEEEEKFIAAHDPEREFCGTEVISGTDESLPYMLASVVKKMMLARVVGEPSVLRLANATTSIWTKAPEKSALQFHLCISKGVKRFYLWEHLGHGADGKAFLVSGGTKGAVGVLKFFFQNDQDSADHEAKMWTAVYSHLPAVSASVRVVKVMGHIALLMPWFQTPKRTQESLEAIETSLKNDFTAKGYHHDDVAWRNVGVYTDSGQVKAVVFDMKRVSKTKGRQGWVALAVDSLRRNLE